MFRWFSAFFYEQVRLNPNELSTPYLQRISVIGILTNLSNLILPKETLIAPIGAASSD